ncbi:oxidoreductase [Sphingomonas sp. URHD0057]|uniref:oxidoreductase n=1 Tax=Sphingomonas sp. URHD0057 TaxID=1380389 RepID=UPI00055D1944|nr:FAD-dependent oxidoreductase [Sphingomonas sp. URHD0057]
MSRDPRYDILFEPVRIGPVTARNRFYQVPHCTGIGWTQPETLARLRGIKAEGGWAVVATEETEIHPSADCEPFHEGRLWDDRDIPALAMTADAIHEHGALAAIEIMHHGGSVANWGTRLAPMAPSHRPIIYNYPVQARAMDKQDIRDLRRWHRDAALRSKKAGFDIVYIYATHDLSIAQQFLERRKNDRTDEYGGSLENRARLLRELIEDTKEAVGDTCAVAVRFCADELMGDAGLTHDGEARDVIGMLAELPDLWDVNISNWPNDSQTSRFAKEGFQEEYTRFVKQLTTKPVVGVGRFTSPDTMVSQIKRGVLDFIGAARPSIADPFLPKKIEEGRIDDIRECIGCNICVSSDYTSTNLRCTQNPTMGEEWRRGWHPEIIPPKKSDGSVLVVGAGPAGLEAALAAARRGFEVHLAEATSELGGRVTRESKLPGLAEWARVRDWRVDQLERMDNVSIYRDSALEAEHVLEFGARHVAIATGSVWRRDGVGRDSGFPIFDGPLVYTPDDIMSGRDPEGGPVIIWDDDHYYMGGVIAELCRYAGHEVVLVTTAATVSAWTVNTLEALPIAKRMARMGVEVVPYTSVSGFEGGSATLTSVLTGETTDRPAAALVTVTGRLPIDGLFEDLRDRWAEAGIASVTRIGDCWAPSTIQQAVYSGHKWARELDEAPEILIPRELPMIESGRLKMTE